MWQNNTVSINALMVSMVNIVIVLTIMVIALDSRVSASPTNHSGLAQTSAQVTHLEQITIGSMVVQGGEQAKLLPLIDTQVDISINGLIARTELKQYFENPSNDVIEATYYFPLPEDSAVDGMIMTIGDRRIVGQIKEKQQAKKIYDAAVKAGKKAALLEQGRANLFRSKVANIGPQEVIEVTLTLYQSVQYDNGEFSLRFPTTITPRYSPQANYQLIETFAAKAWQSKASEQNIITPVVAQEQRHDHQLSIDVTLNAGFPLSALTSDSHAISSNSKHHQYRVTLDDNYVVDRDFILRWRVQDEAQPRLVRFDEQVDTDPGFIYSQLLVIPPSPKSHTPLPRDVTFIIDHSGSMDGQSIKQAKQALATAIDSLTGQDRFNIIGFNHTAHSLFNQTLSATDSTQHQAQSYIRRMAADGGTEMRPALALALNEVPDPGYVRQVVFLTDGAVNNESELFRLIHEQRDQARLFTVGIGSAPNSYFMRKAAEFGQGTYTYINDVAQVAQKMTDLTDRLQSPVMQSIKLGFSEPVEHYPLAVPDLYLGQPLHIIIRRPANDMTMTLDGRLDSIDWRANMVLHKSNNSSVPGIARLWARQKIQQLLDEQIMSGQPDSHREEILTLALEHQLMSPYTSFVAVEERISRTNEQLLKKKDIPNITPKGATGFSYPATGLNWRFNAFWAFILLVVSGVFIHRNHESC